MSDTESGNGETSEEEIEEGIDEVEEDVELSGEGIQTRMKNEGSRVVTVITRNVKVNIMMIIRDEISNDSGGILATTRVTGRQDSSKPQRKGSHGKKPKTKNGSGASEF
jgi:hypothetical protein